VCRHALVRAPPRAVIARGGSKLLTGTAPEARDDPSHLDQDGLSNSDRRSALAKPGAITARPRNPIRVVGARDAVIEGAASQGESWPPSAARSTI
jgi:hypothetical protein